MYPFSKQKKQLKAELKQLAIDIRLGKSFRKPHTQKGDVWDGNGFDLYCFQETNSHYARHKHIVYCLLRGTSYEDVECPKEDNPVSTTTLKRIWKNLNLPEPIVGFSDLKSFEVAIPEDLEEAS